MLEDFLVSSNFALMKFGTESLCNGNEYLDRQVIDKIAQVSLALYNKGKRVSIVTSGGVVCGQELLGRTSDISQRQHLSNIGSSLLRDLYSTAFEKYGLRFRYFPLDESHLDFKNGLSELVNSNLDSGIISGFNNIDVNGDNDPLAAKLAKIFGADSVVFFSNHGNRGSGGGESKKLALDYLKNNNIRSHVCAIEELQNLYINWGKVHHKFEHTSKICKSQFTRGTH